LEQGLLDVNDWDIHSGELRYALLMEVLMRKLGLVLAIITLLAGVSVQAQRKSGKPPIQPPVDFANVIIQDDNGGGYFVLDVLSGEYKCNLCEYGIELSGFGEVKIDGCNIDFTSFDKGYRMFASANMCEQQAKIAIEAFKSPKFGFNVDPIREYWSDTDMRDSTTECKVTPK
jgi:hypothetical protein